MSAHPSTSSGYPSQRHGKPHPIPSQNGGGNGYPSQGRGSPLSVPLAPQVARLLASSPEAAPELAALSARNVACKAESGASPALQMTAPVRPKDTFLQQPKRPPLPDSGVRPPAIGATPTPNRKTAASATSTGAPPVPRRPVRHSATAGGSSGSRNSASRDRKKSLSSSAQVSEPKGTSGSLAVLTEAIVLLDREDGGSLSDVTQLHFRQKGLTSLQLPGTVDFGELISLRVLSLSHNALSDIAPVADLPMLIDLNVNHNQIKDLSPAFQCEGLEVLLAANNRLSSVAGLELENLRHLSLYKNELSDLEAVVQVLEKLHGLRKLDIGGNPCADDPSQSYGIVRALPRLAELDGEMLGKVDRVLAEEFFSCASELGFNERPCSSAGRPQTAPAPSATRKRRQHRPSPSPSRDGSAKRGSRSRSPSPFIPASASASSTGSGFGARTSPPPVEGDVLAIIREQTSQVEAARLQIQTVQVDCENLRRQICILREREPTLGLTGLKEKKQQLSEENRLMHERVAENQRLREVLAEKEAELSAKRLAEGLPEERPRTARPQSSCGPASASTAAEAILELSGRLQSEAGSHPSSRGSDTGGGLRGSWKRQDETEADLRFRNHLLRRELERTKERIAQSQIDACTAVLGQDLVSVSSGNQVSASSGALPPRPRTAAARSSQGAARSESDEQCQDLDKLLQHNTDSLQQLTGQLRQTELAMGLQRPMTTGHLQRPRMAGTGSSAVME